MPPLAAGMCRHARLTRRLRARRYSLTISIFVLFVSVKTASYLGIVDFN
jgi:hypothetical protein